jgi:hypothetical protein
MLLMRLMPLAMEQNTPQEKDDSLVLLHPAGAHDERGRTGTPIPSHSIQTVTRIRFPPNALAADFNPADLPLGAQQERCELLVLVPRGLDDPSFAVGTR